MASSSANLRKALNLIRQGKQAQARPLLTQLLRQEPNNAAAWFLLSYAVEDAQQQEYALLKALQVDPKFERALRRLAQLRGQPLPAAGPETPAAEEMPEAVAQPVEEKPAPPPAESPLQAESVARPTRNWVRLMAFGLLVFVLAIAAYAGYQYLPQLAVSLPSATPLATRALPATWTPVAAATPTHAATPTATTVQFGALDPATQAELDVISQWVSDTRGLAFASPPQSHFVTHSDLISHLATALLDEAKAQELAAEEIALNALGLLGEGDYLTDYQLNRHTDAYGGFYDTELNRILLEGDALQEAAPYTYARLAANALVQQAQAQLAEQTRDCPIFSDACRAQSALLGGDWSLAGEQWLQAMGSPELQQAVTALGDPGQLVQVQAPVAFTQLDLKFAINEGKQFVQAAFDEGGWAGVDELYAGVPASSEQILHAEKYAAGELPRPMQDVSLGTVLGPGWARLASGDLGEWLTYLLLAQGVNAEARVAEGTARAAAAGWNGDQLQVYLREMDQRLAMAQHWVMDTEQDAAQLQSALRQVLAVVYAQPGGDLGGAGECWVSAAVRSCLFAAGTEVLWLIGPDEIVVLQVMLAQYPQFE